MRASPLSWAEQVRVPNNFAMGTEVAISSWINLISLEARKQEVIHVLTVTKFLIVLRSSTADPSQDVEEQDDRPCSIDGEYKIRAVFHTWW